LVVALALAFACIQLVAVSSAATPLQEILLQEGHMGRYLWAAFVETPESKEEPEEGWICLGLSMVEPTSNGGAEGNEDTICGLPPTNEPFIEHITGGGPRPRTAIAVLFPPDAEVRSIVLRLRGRPAQRIDTRAVQLGNSFDLPYSTLRYFAHGYIGKVCIQGMRGFDQEGNLVMTLGRRACV
jgi:hypothetical protein